MEDRKLVNWQKLEEWADILEGSLFKNYASTLAEELSLKNGYSPCLKTAKLV